MSRKQHHRRRPTLETLEGRRLLTITYYPATDTLRLTGTPGRDNFAVTKIGVGIGSVINVQEGTVVRAFGAASQPISLITAELYDDNDTLTVAPDVTIPLNADGGAGDDMIYGGGGVNTLRGGDDNDTLQGGPQGDTLSGGDGSDILIGLGGDDFLYGDDGASARPGNDTVYGGYGNDTIYGYLGNDWLYGEGDKDTIYGGEDSDDHIEGGDADDILYGQGGNDTILGGGGSDTIDGGDDNDNLDGGTEDDTLIGGQGIDTLDGGGGNDNLDGGTENDTLYGDDPNGLTPQGNDILYGGPGDDTLLGLGGDDRLYGEGGDDDLFGGNNDDHLFAGSGRDYLEGDGGDDTLVSIDDDDNDVLWGNGGLDTFWVDKQKSGLSSTTDTVNDADTNEADYSLHEVEQFENGADKTLNGDDIAEPAGGTQWKDFSDKPLFASTGPTVTDIRQGDLGDCWLLSSLAAEAHASPNAVRQLVADLGDGTYVVQLNQKQYRVDAELAVRDDNPDALKYADLGNEGSLWVALVEEAYAIQRGNDYEKLNDDTPYFALGKIGGEDRHWPILPNLSNVVPDATAPGIGGVFCTDKDAADVSVLTDGHCYAITGVTLDSVGEPASVTLYNPYGHDDDKYMYDLQLVSWGDGSGVPYAGQNLIVAGLDNDGLLNIEIFDYYDNKISTFEEKDSSGALHLVTLDHTGILSDVLESSLPAAQAAAITALKGQIPGWLAPHALTGAEKDQVLGELTSITGKAPNYYGDGYDDGFVTITIDALKHDAQHPVPVVYADFSQYNWA